MNPIASITLAFELRHEFRIMVLPLTMWGRGIALQMCSEYLHTSYSTDFMEYRPINNSTGVALQM